MGTTLKEKDLPKFKDIIGLYADDEIDVSTPFEADLQRFTPQQIDDYCEKVLNLCLVARTEGSLMLDSIQIIRQLQKEIQSKAAEKDRDLAKAAMEKMGFIEPFTPLRAPADD